MDFLHLGPQTLYPISVALLMMRQNAPTTVKSHPFPRALIRGSPTTAPKPVVTVSAYKLPEWWSWDIRHT